jgi:hypothetical protein
MREHEAQCTLARTDQLGHDGLEIMAIRSESMQPDHRRRRIGTRFDLDGFA